MNLTAIVVAAGKGSRMKADIPKQFLQLNGKPLYFYPVNTFLNSFAGIEVILVVPENYMLDPLSVLACFSDASAIRLAAGGATRFDSVLNGLKAAGDTDFIFIHDGVRPFIQTSFLQYLLNEAAVAGNAIPATMLNESLRKISGDTNIAVDRAAFRAIQTPQVFKASLISAAYTQRFSECFTDDASVLEAAGQRINLVQGLTENIKITSPEDLQYAQWLMAQ